MELNYTHRRKPSLLAIAIAVVLASVIMSAMYLFSKNHLHLGLPLLLIPFVITFVAFIFFNPVAGLISALCANYLIMGITRYVPGPLGLSVDALLVLTWLAVLFSQFNRRVEWRKAWNGLTMVAILWFLYAVFELFNPEASSREAWFYAMRGVALYMLLTIPLAFLLFNDRKYLNLFIMLWAWFTLAGVAKGAMQQIVGPDPWEQHWLALIGGKTHLLPGGLRVFSFFTDAATYGSSMGFSGVVFMILAMKEKVRSKKIFFWIVSLGAFYGMAISGTRGALAVPFAGLIVYAGVSKQIRTMMGSIFVVLFIFVTLKYTDVGNSVYAIRRFRNGLDKNNDSLQVRLENQKKLKVYLASRPLGGGIGSSGNWGLRFAPNSFLANVPTDSWFVAIWAEQGRVGLILHLSILAFVLITSSYIIVFMLRDPDLKNKASALLAGMTGVMAASYGSGALGQMPNGIIIYISMAFIFMMPRWESNASSKEKIGINETGTE